MYVEHDEIKKRKWFDTEKFIDVHQIKFTGFRCPRPLFEFEHAGFPDYIKNVIDSQESTYPRPTATQCFCWPVLLSGRDIILVSNSGYGKHLSYMLPALMHIKEQPSHKLKNGPSVLLITPHQPKLLTPHQRKDDIYAKTKEYIEAADVSHALIYDSEDKEEQIERLKSHVDLIITNPTRLLEIMSENENLIDLNTISFLIVDEYIQFRKMQAMDNVKKLVEMLKTDRRTAVFSRLVPSGIQRQGDEFVNNSIFVEMHHDKESANDEIKQIVELCDKNLKASRLVEIVNELNKEKEAKILIYSKDKEKCLNLNYELKRHLDIEIVDFRKEEHVFVNTPNSIMTTFKNIGLEIAIPDLQYIINVDFPPNLQTYMDRLRKGVIHYTLFAREDAKHAERLIYSLKQARQEFDQNLFTMAKAWLECGRDMRFMPMMEDIAKGISKSLQEMILSSGDEDSGYNSSNSHTQNSSSNFFNRHDSSTGGGHSYSSSFNRNQNNEKGDDFGDDDDSDDDDDEDDDLK